MGRASGFEKRITGLIAAQGRGLDDQPDLKQARRNCVTVTRILQTAARVSVLWLRVCCMSLGVGVWVTWEYEMDLLLAAVASTALRGSPDQVSARSTSEARTDFLQLHGFLSRARFQPKVGANRRTSSMRPACNLCRPRPPPDKPGSASSTQSLRWEIV